jgi:hypothetical protein
MEGDPRFRNTAVTVDESPVDVLDNLAPNTWVGYGFNLIAVPCDPSKPGCDLGFRLEPQPTLEILEFSKVSKALDRAPKKGTVGLQAEQRVVAALAPVLGVVTDLGTILVSEHGHHRAVEIEDQAGTALRQMDEFLQQSIVGAA